MQGRSGLVQHSRVKEVVVAIDGNSGRAAGRSTFGVRYAGETIGNAADSE